MTTEHEPAITPGTYYAVFGALVVLTFVTVGASFLDLGRWHIAVGLVIGASKAILVLLFFMHLLHAGRLLWLVLGGGILWLGILLGLTLNDYFTRHWAVY
jgi:cytochrome c oxidase subunit IV